jgi:peptidoglycan DL-endopeptidase CwlO
MAVWILVIFNLATLGGRLVRPVRLGVIVAATFGLVGLSAPDAAAAPDRRVVAREVVRRFVMRQVGDDYQWGAEGFGAYDCSGLAWRAWRRAGRILPRTSRDQRLALDHRRVFRKDLRRGDLMFFYRPVSHVAVYVGDNRIVTASPGSDRVRRVRMPVGSYYWQHFTMAARP